jgi:hypothetical protein
VTLLAAWAVFPLVLVALSLGCGMLLEAGLGRSLPGALLAPAGFAVIIVIAALFTFDEATASSATPAVVTAALVGAALRLPRRAPRPDLWLVLSAVAVFAVYAAPVVFSGEPTFAGYIRLDDTATWMAYVDRVMDHGRDLSGLEPSTYQRVLDAGFPDGYPLGSFLPLGVGTQLLGTDVAWLVQPYMATMAALLACCLYWLVRPLVEDRRLRAAVAFGAAQAALLYGYSLWGGIKEVALALGLATLAALTAAATRPGLGWRSALLPAIATAALLAELGTRGFVPALPILGVFALAIWRRRGTRAFLAWAWPAALLVLILAIPAFLTAGAFAPTSGTITDASDLGNLIRPLDLAQYVGIWITGDFRVDPSQPAATLYLVVVALIAAAVGVWFAWRRREALLLYALGTAIGSIAIFVVGSPWVGGKALASGSASLLVLALAGAAAFAARVDRVVGGAALALILAGVLWSNAFAYHDVSLAPYAQLRELERIGEEYAGDGPALMTEYQPYGVRHFLRDLDAEGASELRFRQVTLVDGSTLEKGEWADTDRISLDALLTYRTLVLRRSPAQSRPPSVYSLVRAGDYYDVWQRPLGAARPIAEHLPLGDFDDPGAVPSCGEVRRLAELAGPGGTIAAVPRGPNAVSPLLRRVRVPRAGSYDVYALGGVRNRVTALIDGDEVGSVAMQLNPARQFVHFGRARLSAGGHRVQLLEGGPSLAPGTGGPPPPLGPLVLSPADAASPRIVQVPAARAEQLCGQRLDWLEALPPR